MRALTNQIKMKPNNTTMGDVHSHSPKWNRNNSSSSSSQPSYHCHHSAMQWVVFEVRFFFSLHLFQTWRAHNELATHYIREHYMNDAFFLRFTLLFWLLLFQRVTEQNNKKKTKKKNTNWEKYGFVIKCYKNNNEQWTTAFNAERKIITVYTWNCVRTNENKGLPLLSHGRMQRSSIEIGGKTTELRTIAHKLHNETEMKWK